MGSEVFVVEAKRTPFGSMGGTLSDVAAATLGATAMRAVLESSSVSVDAVDEVIVGQVLSGGCGQAPARQAMRGVGIPDEVPALTINKVCGSGLKAVMLGADSIRLGESGVVVAGGMESMSLAPYFLEKARTGYRMGNGKLIDLMIFDGLTDPYTGRHMGEIGEASVERNGLSREEQDDFALRSYRLAQTAVEEGIFARELVPVIKQNKKGEVRVETDEEPFKVDFDRLPCLKPVFRKDGTITAGNASTINDGAAMLLLAGKEALERHNLTARARIVAQATSSRHPDEFPEAPIGAIEKACARAGLSVEDIDLFEINEAFASVALLAMKAHNIPIDKVNVNGGACAIGHPIGASGARLATTLVHELDRRQKRYGLATLCIGGGEAVAVIFERI
ncbi:thiolase family protein [Geoalkalibacter subterraneus]|uniref:Acetyl-CoA acetyltransferase n=1 Tax=Geoalkalibacter subterraneus TaxID=483547 RepID=A0A0B5FH84_9BACT|nr:thiolase family protein [Geoalkalibacter subterraneus]AJF06743.1 acetyl-CoA acetyltransferase [Geoalkalibacter subterraneus]